MKTIDSFLRWHEVDVGRCLAVLLFADAVQHAYSLPFGAYMFFFDFRTRTPLASLGDLNWLVAGLCVLLGLLVAAEVWLAAALWRHRPWARRVCLLLASLVLAFLVACSIGGPFIHEYSFSFGGFETKNPGDVFRVLAPIAIMPVFGCVMFALNAPVTRARFES